MPVAVKDRSGTIVRVVFKNVRCVPTFSESLLSVTQLWDSSSTECRFGAHNDVISPPQEGGHRHHIPFSRSAGPYVLRAVAVGARPDSHTVAARCLAVLALLQDCSSHRRHVSGRRHALHAPTTARRRHTSTTFADAHRRCSFVLGSRTIRRVRSVR
eukprot:4035942-Pleurochrysis_carterae.AAC.1